jgi:hypothetical protein
MLAEFREAVATIADTVRPDLPLWSVLPDDVNAVPCVVVGLPAFSPGREQSIVDLEVDVWAVGRRQTAGDNESELLTLVGDMMTAFGGTRGTVAAGGYQLAATQGTSRVVDIAGQRTLAYLMTVTASAVEC